MSGQALSWDAATAALRGPVTVSLHPRAQRQLAQGRAVVERHCADEAPIYGINTGFGIFARTRISKDDLFQLQHNIVVSHAAGVGAPFDPGITRLILLLKLHTLSKGYSGVRPVVAEYLVRLLNADCLPIIPEQGSVGASGDLAPLAHMAAALLGVGDVLFAGKRIAATQALRRIGMKPLVLHPKEGLALVNGTQVLLAVAIAAIALAREVITHAEIAGGLTIEGLFGSIVPFDRRLHAVRPHPGAMASAAALRRLLQGSRVIASHKHCGRVQDPYALRCIPSVHGIAREAYASVYATARREIESVTDNPIVFADTEEILSGGNFHGAPIALAMDYLAVAVTTLSSIAERRIEQMTNPKADELSVRGLVRKPGLNSGYMVPHVTAASLVSENKGLAHPASVDTISTWAGQEDHVSMGLWAARKALKIVENTATVVGIELLAACQAIDLHPVRYRLGRGTAVAYRAVRALIPTLDDDRFMAPELAVIRQAVGEGTVRTKVERAIGALL